MGAEFRPGIQDCPHCLSRVFILGNGICPGCQKNARETSSQAKMAAWIHVDDKLPDLCHKCGSFGDRSVQFNYRESTESPEKLAGRGSDDGIWWAVTLGLAGVLLAVIIAFIRQLFGINSARKYETLSIRIPVCPDCKPGIFEPITASIPDRAMKIAVHPQFGKEHESLNYPQSSGNTR